MAEEKGYDQKYDADKDGKLNDAEKAVQKYDINNDGSLNANESAYKTYDTDGNGLLSEAQLKDKNASQQVKTLAANQQRKEDQKNGAKSAGALGQGTTVTDPNQKYNQIIYQSFDIGGGQRSSDDFNSSSQGLVDILDDYKWTIDTFKNGFQGSMIQGQDSSGKTRQTNYSVANIPHCYVVEYQQRYSSNITNFVNTLVAAVTALNDADLASSMDAIGNQIDSLKNALWNSVMGDNEPDSSSEARGEKGGTDKTVSKGINAMYTGIKGGINWLADKTINNIAKNIKNGVGNSSYLAPYKLLYDLNATNQKYVFPMVAQPPINKVINTYGEKQEDTSILSSNNLLNWFNKVAEGTVSFARDLKDLGALSAGGKALGFQLSNVEKAKYFNYPTDTEEYSVSFPLLNTVRSNSSTPEWQKNYKFIMLFTLRNMVFRRDNASFFPPLFYDLIIPGVIRQPFCYVREVSIKPLGATRMLGVSNLFSFLGGGSYAVAVPEAWIVTIKFKSLLATSANMVLSGLTDLKVNVR